MNGPYLNTVDIHGKNYKVLRFVVASDSRNIF
jgi:hypothetical protein